MATAFTPAARRLGLLSAGTVFALQLGYAVALAFGFASLASPDDAIGDPWFWILEILILMMAPAMVTLMIAVHAWAPEEAKPLSLAALVFMSIAAGATACVHFVLLTVSRHPEAVSQPRIFSFQWPSVVYALDILAWDVFFALSMLFAAAVFRGDRLAKAIRGSMIVSGVLALAGLAGVAAGDMQLRNIGITGYVGVFLVVAVLLTLLFRRPAPVER